MANYTFGKSQYLKLYMIVITLFYTGDMTLILQKENEALDAYILILILLTTVTFIIDAYVKKNITFSSESHL